MIELLKTVKTVAMAVCCHRAMYAGVALAYGAGLSGLCGRAVGEAGVGAAYLALAARGLGCAMNAHPAGGRAHGAG